MTVWLLSTCILTAALILLRRVLRGRVDPRLTYALWLLAALRVLVPGSLFASPVSVDAMAERTGLNQAVERVRYVGGENTKGNTPLENSVSASFAPSESPQTAISGGQPAGVPAGGAVPARPAVLPGQTGRDGPDAGAARDRFAPLRWVWGTGAALMAAWFVLVNARFALRLRRGRKPFQGELPVPCPLPVYVVEGLPSPCLFGFFRPAVYLNGAAAENGRLDHILTHELVHCRHGDQWWALVRCACVAAQWFNPLVWAAAWLSRQDCELACDAAAVKMLGETERLPYGRTLVGMIAAARAPGSVFHTATTMSGTVGSIQERITLIARRPKMTALTLSCALLTAAVAAGCAFGGAGASPAEEYLEDNSQEQIFEDFVPATTIMIANRAGFPDPASIPSSDLWGFFTLVAGDEIDAGYNPDEKQYYVPASTVREILDGYLEGYVFEPSQVGYAEYAPQTDMFTFPAYSYGSGKTEPVFWQAQALDKDTVQVEFSNRFGDNEIVTGKITDGGVRYLSCVLTDYTTYGAERPSTEQLPAWRLDEGTITTDYLTELIAALEMSLGANKDPDGFLFYDPIELTDEQLFKAFLIQSDYSERVKYWDEETETFRFPEEFVKSELQKYFKRFEFDITKVHGYDPASGLVVMDTASGLGGDVYLEVTDYSIIGNVVNFTAQFCTNYTMYVVEQAKEYAVEFYDGGYYFLSAVTAAPPVPPDFAAVLEEDADAAAYHPNGWDPATARGVYTWVDGDMSGPYQLALCYVDSYGRVGAEIWGLEGDQAVRLIQPAALGYVAEEDAAGIHTASFQGKDWLCCWSVSTDQQPDGDVSTYALAFWDLSAGTLYRSPAPYCLTMVVDAGGGIEDAWGDAVLFPMDQYREMLRCMIGQPTRVLCRLGGGGEPVGLTPQELLEVDLPPARKLAGAEPSEPAQGGYEAERSLWEQVFGQSGYEGSVVSEYTILGPYMLDVAAALRALPDWVSWKPLEVQPYSFQLVQCYFKGDMPNFSAEVSFLVKLDDAARAAWLRYCGGTLTPAPDGEYAGWWVYTAGVAFIGDERGGGLNVNRHSGDGSLLLPVDPETASLPELLDLLMFLTAGPCCDDALRNMLTRFSPDEINGALMEFHPDTRWQAQSACRMMGDFLREYGGTGGIPAYAQVYGALTKSSFQVTMEQGVREAGGSMPVYEWDGSQFTAH